MKKDMAQLMDTAKSQGWSIELAKGGHFKWVSPSGAVVFTSCTPSDKRAFKNIQSDLRRYGLDIVKKNARRKDRLQ